MLTEVDLVRRIDGLTVEELHYCVQRGWLAPSTGGGGTYFLEVDVARLRFVRELRFDLEVDEDAIPMLLSLVDQVHTLRHELRAVAEAIQEQPADIQDEIAAAVRRLSEEA